MAIISASYKTDIPAFYGEWFENRLAASFADIRNPFNNTLSKVSLAPEEIDGFVFWTRNMDPFMARLDSLIAGKFPFYIQYTVTGYPRLLENSVVSAEAAILHIKALALRYGKRSVVWRYDPIFISSITPIAFHLENFKKISGGLAGATDEVVVSFAQFYQKTQRNLKPLTEDQGMTYSDPGVAEKQLLLEQLRQIAGSNEQCLSLCTQPELEHGAVQGAACVSADRLGLGRSVKVQGNRKGCLCVAARDIGGYDTCPHGCVYCYAVTKRAKAKTSYKNHNPHSTILA